MAKYNVEDFRDWGIEKAAKARDGRYVLARPENYKFDSWRYRLKLALTILPTSGEWCAENNKAP